MGEEPDVERFRGLRTDGGQLLAHGIDSKHGAGEATESARIGHGDRKRAALHACHGGLNDGKIDPEKFPECHANPQAMDSGAGRFW